MCVENSFASAQERVGSCMGLWNSSIFLRSNHVLYDCLTGCHLKHGIH